MGRFTTDSICFGVCGVSGRSRVPNPPTGTTARIEDALYGAAVVVVVSPPAVVVVSPSAVVVVSPATVLEVVLSPGAGTEPEPSAAPRAARLAAVGGSGMSAFGSP